MAATIVSVETGKALEQVRALFQEYWNSFGFTPCFQGFGAELAGLPGAYAPPRGRLLLACVDGEPAGCAAFRPFDERRAEAKRLYVRPAYRGGGIGRSLLERVIEEARAAGYEDLLGDTLPVMGDALRMYDRRGFERIPPYIEQPASEAIFLRLRLRPGALA